jgi:hypothetical protein
MYSYVFNFDIGGYINKMYRQKGNHKRTNICIQLVTVS